MASANGTTQSKTATSGSDQSTEFAASKQAALEAFEKLLEAKDHFTTAATATGLDMKTEAMDRLQDGKARLGQAGEKASQTVKEKPLAAIGLAFLAGLLVSLLFPRR